MRKTERHVQHNAGGEFRIIDIPGRDREVMSPGIPYAAIEYVGRDYVLAEVAAVGLSHLCERR